MKAGELDQRIHLFSPKTGTDDGYTTLPSGWQSEGERWARYVPGSVREVFESMGREGEMPAVFMVRRDSVSERVNETWKLTHMGTTYDVEGAVRAGRDGIRITAVGTDEGGPES